MNRPIRRAWRPSGFVPWVVLWTVLFFLVNRAPILGRAAPIWDAKDSFFPFFVLVADHARAGRLVSWDVWSNAGLPRLGDPEFGAVWPLQLIVGLGFGGTPAGFIAYWMIVWWLGGLGIFLLARHLRAPPWAAFVIVCGFTWSGVYTGNAEHISWLVGFSSVPYVIWRLDRALTTRTWLPAVQSGAIWGAAATGAYPGLTISTAMLMVVWTIGRVAFASEADSRSAPTESRSRLHGAPAVAAAGVVGLLCLLPTYVSFFYEGAGVHLRTGPLPREVVLTSNALMPGALVTSVSPHFSSLKLHRTSPPLWPVTDVSSVSVYTGAAALVLAIAALVLTPLSGWRWFLAAVALLSLGIAVGGALPLRGWLYEWVYPTRFFRHPAMFRLYFVFTLTVLALIGAGDAATSLSRSPALRRRCGTIAVAVAAVACFVYWLALPTDASDFPDAGLGRRHLLVVWGGTTGVGLFLLVTRGSLRVVVLLLVGLACVDAVLAAALTRQTMVSATPGDVAWWRGQFPLHVSDIDLTGRGLVRTREACESNPPCTEPNTWGMITKVPALSTYTAASNPFFDGTVADPALAESAIGPARVWFSPDVARVDLDFEIFRRLIDRTRALGGISITVHDEQSMLDPTLRAHPVSNDVIERLPRAERLPTAVERYTANELSLTVDPPSAGWLLVTERWARGWRASVDGRPAQLFGGNFIFRAVEVPKGRHRIDFRYEPLAVPWLVAVSWATMLTVTSVSVAAARRHRS